MVSLGLGVFGAFLISVHQHHLDVLTNRENIFITVIISPLIISILGRVSARLTQTFVLPIVLNEGTPMTSYTWNLC